MRNTHVEMSEAMAYINTYSLRHLAQEAVSGLATQFEISRKEAAMVVIKAFVADPHASTSLVQDWCDYHASILLDLLADLAATVPSVH